MKKYSKVGNRPGKPAYRTPSSFIIRKTSHLYKPPRIKSLVYKLPPKPKKK